MGDERIRKYAQMLEQRIEKGQGLYDDNQKLIDDTEKMRKFASVSTIPSQDYVRATLNVLRIMRDELYKLFPELKPEQGGRE